MYRLTDKGRRVESADGWRTPPGAKPVFDYGLFALRLAKVLPGSWRTTSGETRDSIGLIGKISPFREILISVGESNEKADISLLFRDRGGDEAGSGVGVFADTRKARDAIVKEVKERAKEILPNGEWEWMQDDFEGDYMSARVAARDMDDNAMFDLADEFTQEAKRARIKVRDNFFWMPSLAAFTMEGAKLPSGKTLDMTVEVDGSRLTVEAFIDDDAEISFTKPFNDRAPRDIFKTLMRDSRVARIAARKLVKRQEKLLDDWAKKNPTLLRRFTDYDELPEMLRSTLERISDHETLWSDVNRYLGDLQMKLIYSRRRRAEADSKGIVTDIETETLENDNFRKVLFTGSGSQLVLMSLLPGEDIGLETHDNLDQFIRIDAGQGKSILDGEETELTDGSAVVVVAGTPHNIVNTSETEPLKLYTVYSEVQHEPGAVQKTKADAEAAEAAEKEASRRRRASVAQDARNLASALGGIDELIAEFGNDQVRGFRYVAQSLDEALKALKRIEAEVNGLLRASDMTGTDYLRSFGIEWSKGRFHRLDSIR